MASKIEDYGFISNMHTGALVSKRAVRSTGCARPRFDSDACFAALVGYDEHGRWALRPTVPIRKTSQRYRGDTLILETEFVCEGGVVRITDFMPIADGSAATSCASSRASRAKSRSRCCSTCASVTASTSPGSAGADGAAASWPGPDARRRSRRRCEARPGGPPRLRVSPASRRVIACRCS